MAATQNRKRRRTPAAAREAEQATALSEVHHASLVFWDDAALTGNRRSRALAVVLEAIAAQLSGFEDGKLLDELESAAHEFFTRHPNLMMRPFAETRAAGADELYRILLESREAGDSNTAMALNLLTEVQSSRPGLPTLRRWAEAPTRAAQKRLAMDLRDAIVASLDKVDRSRRSGDAEAWAESATRAVLRTLGDPDAENAFKHRMKK